MRKSVETPANTAVFPWKSRRVCREDLLKFESDPIISANQRIPVMQTAREGFKNWVGQENGEIDHQEGNGHVA